MPTKDPVIIFRKEEESWQTFLRRIRETTGEMIVILSTGDAATAEEREEFLKEASKVRYRFRLATKDKGLASAARKAGIQVFDRTHLLKYVLNRHPQKEEALRVFSPLIWRQQWRSRLQKVGLLSFPRLRVWLLISLSVLLFLFVVFRLLPSAEIKVWPRQDTLSQTTNLYFVESGAQLEAESQVRELPLFPIAVVLTKSLNYTQISKQFTGNNSELPVVIVNSSSQAFTFRKGTRIVNQAGMVFKLQSWVDVPSGGRVNAVALADDQDIYGEDLGERGNVPAGLKWDIPGLPVDQRKLFTVLNTAPGKGGKTASRTVLQQKDLDTASENLKKELLAEAKTLIEQKLQVLNTEEEGRTLQFLTPDDVIKKTYTGFVVPTDLLGKPVTVATVQGTLLYTMLAYDSSQVLSLLGKDAQTHVVKGKRMLPSSLSPDRLRVYVIGYDDHLTWVKVTADLQGAEQFILDPLTPGGAEFAKRVREETAGLSTKDALRIVKNMPEVEKAEIRLWPPWGGGLPAIPSHILVSAQ